MSLLSSRLTSPCILLIFFFPGSLSKYRLFFDQRKSFINFISSTRNLVKSISWGSFHRFFWTAECICSTYLKDTMADVIIVIPGVFRGFGSSPTPMVWNLMTKLNSFLNAVASTIFMIETCLISFSCDDNTICEIILWYYYLDQSFQLISVKFYTESALSQFFSPCEICRKPQ